MSGNKYPPGHLRIKLNGSVSSYDLQLDQKLGNETTTLVESYEVIPKHCHFDYVIYIDADLFFL